ncbi:DgyrCDS4141 [Dimorphilus gyrociliatus]|uniref:DgyrCDS4141 n=1 Tax=Dimorphilus gyrociliatus TaxID=2664684 RepID=A0A7I8VG30_9ANNE|nr:DgyrCDS4141 [Dimorphilus gyrociliatus]
MINTFKRLLNIVTIFNCMTPNFAVTFLSAPKYVVAKLGDTFDIHYSLSEAKQIRLESLYNDTSASIFEPPNFDAKFKDRWKVTPSGESSSYTFTVTSSEKIDGLHINASIVGGSSTDYRKTGVVLYESNPTAEEYPKTVIEGEKFNVVFDFKFWGAGSFGSKLFVNDTWISSSKTESIFYDGLAKFKEEHKATWKIDNQNMYFEVKLYRNDDTDFVRFKSDDIKIRVEYKVRDIKITSDQDNSDKLKNGDELICTAMGNPVPKYEWRKVKSFY